MRILGIDTSTKILSIALVENDSTIDAFDDETEFGHSDLLIPAVDRILKEGNLGLKDISAIALSIGPGSFTGLRIGVATAKAINAALKIPIVAVPTLDVIAYNFVDGEERMLCPVLDAKKGKVYACFYNSYPKLTKLSDYLLVDIAGLLKKVDKPALFFGDAVMVYQNNLKKNRFVEISVKDWHPKAEIVAKFGLEKLKKRKIADPDRLAPIYMHSGYCQVSVK